MKLFLILIFIFDLSKLYLTNDISDLIFSGRAVKEFNEFAFQVVLQYNRYDIDDPPPYSKFCSGSIIETRWILTAAHCIKGVEKLKDFSFKRFYINAGEADAFCYSDKSQLLRVAQFFKHPEYEKDGLKWKNDIALLYLETPLNFTKNQVWPIKLPNKDLNYNGSNSSLFRISGWGITNDTMDEGNVCKIMKWGYVPVLTYNECKKLNLYKTMHKENICAGGQDGPTTCVGDSGGPLIYKPNQMESYLIGVTSYGHSYCISYPSVFTNVVYYLDWINETIKSNRELINNHLTEE